MFFDGWWYSVFSVLAAWWRGIELFLSTPVYDWPGLWSRKSFSGEWIEEWLEGSCDAAW